MPVNAIRRHPTTSAILAAVGLLALATVILSARAARLEEPAPTTTTSSSSSTTTTEATTTTTAPTTTAAPTTAPRPTAAPTSVVRTTLPATPAPPPPATTEPEADPCGRARVGVAAVGLPPGVGFYCSAEMTAYDSDRPHAGVACWNCGVGPSAKWIAINPRTGNHEGVGAHEACHIQQFATTGETSEASADACAAAHGWPNPYAGTGEDVIVAPDRTMRWLEISVLAAILATVLLLFIVLLAVRRRLNRKDV